MTSPDRLTGMLQVDKKVITAIAEGKADPDARLLKVGNSVNYTDIISTLCYMTISVIKKREIVLAGNQCCTFIFFLLANRTKCPGR